jgi:hypothetical protein
MFRMHITAYALLTVGILSLVGLTGLSTVAAEETGLSVVAAEENTAPLLQPSPRPTPALPTPRPTSALPTPEHTPTTGAPTSEPSQTSAQTPSPTPTSTLLPDAGGAFYGAWLLGLGICLTLLGIVCMLGGRRRA